MFWQDQKSLASIVCWIKIFAKSLIYFRGTISQLFTNAHGYDVTKTLHFQREEIHYGIPQNSFEECFKRPHLLYINLRLIHAKNQHPRIKTTNWSWSGLQLGYNTIQHFTFVILYFLAKYLPPLLVIENSNCFQAFLNFNSFQCRISLYNSIVASVQICRKEGFSSGCSNWQFGTLLFHFNFLLMKFPQALK